MSKNKEYLLSVSTDKDGSQVFIHADINGILALEKSIAFLKRKLAENECDHDHFHSESWAGDELSETMLEQEKEAGCKQVHHVKIYGWNQEWKINHNL
ncbi:Imm32 family immunity protein [Teredinibacter purpureus]|uniref:Imm32 family immunity protein n=1 Tax=Teredinibacter purpureus TaxID=2731756 RepID=UPI0005F7A1A5|nr:Imm32 family immunity protein [Teredinibacter purpureus]